MTEKQRKFADEYLIDCNGTRAYKAAYPNVKKDSTAAAAATRMLKNVKVAAYIDEKLAEISSHKTADAQEVMEYLTSVLRGESEAEVVVVEGYGEGCSEAKRIKKNPDERERLKAAELLGKRFGLFTEKVNLEGTAKVVIVDDLDT
jgi:phage terminase small subunit